MMFNSSRFDSSFARPEYAAEVVNGSLRVLYGGTASATESAAESTGTSPPWNDSCVEQALDFNTPEKIVIGVILAVITTVTVIGNTLVVIAVCVVKKLRKPSNYLLVSLAVADLSVAIVVMPFVIVTDLTGGKWLFGEVFCNIFIGMDVMCCTASIMTLCVISVDRYLGITRPLTYPARQNGQLMAKMIVGVWLVSASITLPPFCGWAKNINAAGVCLISQDFSYTIYSTAVAFYIPMLVMLCMYYKIFKAARKSGKKHRLTAIGRRDRRSETSSVISGVGTGFGRRERRSETSSVGISVVGTSGGVIEAIRMQGLKSLPEGVHSNGTTEASASSSLSRLLDSETSGISISTVGGVVEAVKPGCLQGNGVAEDYAALSRLLGTDTSRVSITTIGTVAEARRMQGLKSQPGGLHGNGVVEERISLSARLLGSERHDMSIFKREQKAATTLGVIVGVFSVCWLPFFLLSTARPFVCGVECSCAPVWLERTLLWFGYANSLINPFIYAFFNRDLRSTYRDLLRCRYRNINRRLSAVGVHEALKL